MNTFIAPTAFLSVGTGYPPHDYSLVVNKLQFENVIDLKQTETFRKWRTRLKDERARVLIASRLDRLAFGHAGDAEPVGQGISELRIHYSSGYRIYFQRRGNTIIVLLCGGDKSTQAKDIKAAKRLADECELNVGSGGND